MTEINLEKILDKRHDPEFSVLYTKYEILEAMKEACNQTVDLCVENSLIRHTEQKGSILKTKDQIK